LPFSRALAASGPRRYVLVRFAHCLRSDPHHLTG
jgi:hypothetical protein